MEHALSYTYMTVMLKPLGIGDIETTRKLRNRRSSCFACTAQITESEQLSWYEGYLDIENEYMFSINYDGGLVGQVGLYGVDAEEGVCEFGRLVVDEQFKGRHLGEYATVAACRIAFHSLGLRTVLLEVLSDNEAARIVYSNVGFVCYDRRQLEDGRSEDLMKLTRGSFEERWGL